MIDMMFPEMGAPLAVGKTPIWHFLQITTPNWDKYTIKSMVAFYEWTATWPHRIAAALWIACGGPPLVRAYARLRGNIKTLRQFPTPTTLPPRVR